MDVFLNTILDELERPVVTEFTSNQKQSLNLMVAVLLQVLQNVREDRFLVERFRQDFDKTIPVDDLNRRVTPD